MGGTGQGTKRKQPSEALTNWRQHREAQVRTEESDQATGTHILEMAPGGTKSGHEKEATERRALTSCRPRRDGQVRTQNGIDRVRGTHQLETALGRTSQDTGRQRLSEGYSHPEDRIGRNNSGHRKKATERGALTNWRPHR